MKRSTIDILSSIPTTTSPTDASLEGYVFRPEANSRDLDVYINTTTAGSVALCGYNAGAWWVIQSWTAEVGRSVGRFLPGRSFNYFALAKTSGSTAVVSAVIMESGDIR